MKGVVSCGHKISWTQIITTSQQAKAASESSLLGVSKLNQSMRLWETGDSRLGLVTLIRL